MAAEVTLDVHFTPTQQRLLAVLADGGPHTREELQRCVGEDIESENNLRMHLSLLRKKLRPLGQDVLSVNSGVGFHYRHIRYLASPYDGHK